MVKSLICALPFTEWDANKCNNDIYIIRQTRFWCFDLAYIDTTSWKNYIQFYIDLPTQQEMGGTTAR